MPLSDSTSMPTPTQPTTARPLYSGIVRFSWKRCRKPISELRNSAVVQNARGRRIEIDRHEARPPAALAAALLARRDGRGPTGALGHAHHHRLEAAAERRACAREQRRRRLRRPLRDRIAVGIDERVDMVVPDQQRAGDRDRNRAARRGRARSTDGCSAKVCADDRSRRPTMPA